MIAGGARFQASLISDATAVSSDSVEVAGQLEIKLHKEGISVRVGIVGCDGAEAVAGIELYGFRHFWRERVEAHMRVTDVASVGEDALDELPAESQPACVFSEVEAFHLTDAVAERTHCDAPGRFAIDLR